MQFTDLKTQYAALKPNIDARIQRVLDHGQYIMGPEVAELEAALAAFTGTRHCIAVASGTEALLIALMALGIGPGDEVIVPAFTFAASAEVVILAGATPVLVDIEPDTCNVDVRAVEAAITERTRAIIPVSLYGQPADMDAINAIAAKHKIPVIEDAAQSFGATYKGRRSCNLSTIGCTSFFPSKPLGCFGDGGALFTNDTALAQAALDGEASTEAWVTAFEREVADYIDVKHAIAVANGTDSLYIIMKMLGIGRGDEVITVANSWISSSETITQTGAKPVFTCRAPLTVRVLCP